MRDVTSVLTVYYDGQFWVGVYERTVAGLYEVCKITFGPQPSDAEIYEFLLGNYNRLRFGKAVEADGPGFVEHGNPKRAQREAKRATEGGGVGTKAQQVLRTQYEQGKEERRTLTREERGDAARRKFELHQLKRAKKHKGH